MHIRRTIAAAALGAFALAATLPAAPAAPASAEDGAKAAAAAGGVQWIETWDAGRTAGLEKKKVLFVYVHRVNPG